MNSMRHFIYRGNQSGFSLMELVVTIIILGIVAGMTASFLQRPITQYMDTVRRAELGYLADSALQRVSRDVQRALPNSVRATTSDSNQCFEFIPQQGVGRYRANPFDSNADGVPDGGDVISFTATNDDSFDVITQQGLPDFSAAGKVYYAVVYNLGIPGVADAYDDIGSGEGNRARIASGSSSTHIQLASAHRFDPEPPPDPPRKRFFVIPNQVVGYSCSNNILYRFSRTLPDSGLSQLTACPTAGDVVSRHVSSCNFDYVTSNSVGMGQLSMRIAVSKDDETVQLYREVYVSNEP